MPRVQHPPDVKAQALAQLYSGASVHAVARQLGVSPSTVGRWRDEPETLALRHEMQHAATIDLGALIGQYLVTNLGSLTRIAQSFGDPSWLRDQSAADRVAVHHELAERALRILSSIQPDAGGADPDPADPELAPD